MSEHFITVIPSDPEFLPVPENFAACKRLFESFFQNADEVEECIEKEVVFVDQGENFESVFCPNCSSQIQMDWWQLAMNNSHESRFRDLTVVTPCCGHRTSLNDLDYRLPAGFARCWLRVRNPRIRELSPEQLAQLATMLGTSVRQVWAHY